MSNFDLEDEALAAFSDDNMERFARHLVLPEIGAIGQLKLSRAKVAVLGVGGIGCPVAQALAQVGVGHLTLIDPDTIDRSNLPRQMLFREADIGRPKALVAAEVLEEAVPDLSVRVETRPLREASAEHLLGGHDLVIDGTDNYGTRCAAAAFCQGSGRGAKLIGASVTGTDGQILALDDTTKLYTDLFPEGPPPEQSCAEVGVLATSSMVLGQLAANTAVQWIVSERLPASALVSTWPLRIMRLSVGA